MKLSLLLAATLLAGCAAHSPGRRMAQNDLDTLKAGMTTRNEMLRMFGSPMFQGLDTNGKVSAAWNYNEVFAAPFVTPVVRKQMLSAVFQTNDVLERFVLTDDFKGETNAPPVKPAHAAR